MITPVCFSDHSLIKCVMTNNCIKAKSAYWHFNKSLLCDSFFREVFREFWMNVNIMKLFCHCNSGGIL